MNMQAFHEWLFSTKSPEAYQRCLVGLTYLSRKQLLDAAGAVTWYIWNAPTPVAV